MFGYSKVKRLQAENATLQIKLATVSDNLRIYKLKYGALVDEWNALVNKINKKGGGQFLHHGVLPNQSANGFTKEEIKMLIFLCHPDKHGNSSKAEEITKKLLEMR